MNHTFEAYQNDRLLFYSDRHWLHPIFEFEAFLKNNSLAVDTLLIKDKIIGRAAALLLVRLGVRRIEAQTLSKLGQTALEHYSVVYEYHHLVERIGCSTEDILCDELDPEKAYRIIAQRIDTQGKKQD